MKDTNWYAHYVFEKEKSIKLRAEIKQLRGEKPLPSTWWKDCPGVAQRVMERIINKNDNLLVRNDKLVEKIKAYQEAYGDLDA